MTLFDDAPGPRVFAAPPGANFTRLLAEGLRARLRDQPTEAIARVSVAVNTRRTARALTEAFETADAVFLPRILNIDDLAPPSANGPPDIGALRRTFALSRLIERFHEADPNLRPASRTTLLQLAASLGDLLDECGWERVEPDALRTACADDRFAEHWRIFSDFFAFTADLWPQILDDFGCAEPARRRAAAVDALLAEWGAAPFPAPLIAAGSTGSRKLTEDMLVAIANAPQGAIVLPGFDFAMDAAAWAMTEPDHPQHRFRMLLERLGISPQAVRPWLDGVGASAVSARGALLTQALRPAPVTHHWLAAREDLRPRAEDAVAQVSLLEAANPRAEADAIAAAIRFELAKPNADVALITPDRSLARRVAAALGRWGVIPDDSSGEPLSLTPPGAFIRLTARFVAGGFDPVTLFSILKHPLCCGAKDRAAFAMAVSRLEQLGFRRGGLRSPLTTIDDILAAKVADRNGDETPLVEGETADMLAALRPWSARRSLAACVADHLALLDALSGAEIWNKAAGAAAARALSALEEAAEIIGDVDAGEYPAYLDAALTAAEDVREEAFVADARVRILGPLEARAQSADLMILAGLNDGVWPRAPAIDPWLSRPMRAEVGLPAPEQRIGLSAHDFQQAASAPRVMLSRSLRADGAPTIESRWLTRLRTLLNGLNADGDADMSGDGPLWRGMKARCETFIAAARALDAHEGAPAPEPRPMPTPPVSARPRRISVTDVERLIRDPYEVYARRVLRLHPMPPLASDLDARLRGEMLHKAMELLAAVDTGPDAALLSEAYDRIADQTVAASGAGPATALAWRARLARVKPWFIAEEVERRRKGAPAGLEAKGALILKTAAGPVELSGRADRIDRLTSGELAIYDYKSGSAPTRKQTEIFAKQLPLLGAMAERGAFDDLTAAAVSRLAYIVLSGADDGGKEVTVEAENDALAGLVKLLNAFFAPDAPYPPRAYVEKTSAFAGDYDHLSRFGEWTDRAPASAPPSAGGRS